MKKTVLFITLMLVYITLLFGGEFYFTLLPQYDILNNYLNVSVSATGDFDYFYLKASIYFCNDGMYYEGSGLSKYYFGFYFDIPYGYLGFKYKNLRIESGRRILSDVVESPYSLFISGERHSAPSALIEYSSENFLYRTVWILLTKNIPFAENFPDRGMNFNVIALRFGNFRVGFQQSIIYVGRQFDFEYFFNPIPNFLTQYKLYGYKPFVQGTDDNSFLGFFGDYKTTDLYMYAQIFVDDFNMNRFYGGYQNPDEIAWSVGGSFETNYGKFGFYHAGATKYTFEPRVANTGYVFYPKTIVKLGSVATRTLLPEENYVGFKYGENTLAFLFTYENDVWNGRLSAQFEYLLSGSKSYNNPWQELSNFPYGTHILDEESIEKSLRISISYEKKILDALKIFGKFEYKYIWNVLKPVLPEDGGGYVLKPSSDNEQKVNFILGFQWRFNVLGNSENRGVSRGNTQTATTEKN